MSIFERQCFGWGRWFVCPRCRYEGLLLAFLPFPFDVWQGIYCALSLCGEKWKGSSFLVITVRWIGPVSENSFFKSLITFLFKLWWFYTQQTDSGHWKEKEASDCDSASEYEGEYSKPFILEVFNLNTWSIKKSANFISRLNLIEAAFLIQSKNWLLENNE